MRCTNCGQLQTRALDTRVIKNHQIIKRRRSCLNCGARFTTYEQLVQEVKRCLQ